jgi:hypothetical protein
MAGVGWVTGSTGASPLMAAEMLGDKARAARVRGRDGTGRRSSEPHAGLACTGSSGSCTGSRVRARSGLQLEQAVGSTGEKRKRKPAQKKESRKKLEERNKMDLNKILEKKR